MSQVYATEPQTAGRVILETTHGPLDIQLWSRECPKTTKLFLQLCLDGYYDGMLFHRIVPNFLIQTGALRQPPGQDTTTTTALMDEPYRQHTLAPEALTRRKYEVNNRIRFNHRGQVAMALTVTADETEEVPMMQPQFFITLDDAGNLDGTHVVFGTINGPTVFNALRIGRTDVNEETHQPTTMEHAPRIERVKIVDNPIHTDLVPTPVSMVAWKNTKSLGGADSNNKDKSKRKKRKAVNNRNLLSFGGELEEEEEEEGVTPFSSSSYKKGSGMKSSHDVIQSDILKKEVDERLKNVLNEDKDNDNDIIQTKDPAKHNSSGVSTAAKIPKSDHGQKESLEESQNDQPPESSSSSQGEHRPQYASTTARLPPPLAPSSVKVDRTDERTNHDDDKNPQPVSFVEARRAKYKKGPKDKRKREQDTMAKLFAFQSKIRKTASTTTIDDQSLSTSDHASSSKEDNSLAARMARRQQQEQQDENGKQAQESDAPTYHGQILDEDDDDDNDAGGGMATTKKDTNDWLTTRFKCRKHMDHDKRLGGDGRNAMEDYEVVDEGLPSSSGKKPKHQHHRGRDKRKNRR